MADQELRMIILNAGKAERLLPLTQNTPKSLLDLGHGVTLLEEQIKRIRKAPAIKEVVLVVGYLADQIEAKLKAHNGRALPIRTTYNPFYETSNNLISLWFSKHEMDQDFVVTNGDNLFSEDVLPDLAKEKDEGIYFAVNTKNHYDDDDMKVRIVKNLVVEVRKTIPAGNYQVEAPGLVLVRGERYRTAFRDQLETLVRSREYMDKFWLEVFNALAAKGIPVHPWHFAEQHTWQEVDIHLDVDKVKSLLNVHLSPPDA